MAVLCPRFLVILIMGMSYTPLRGELDSQINISSSPQLPGIFSGLDPSKEFAEEIFSNSLFLREYLHLQLRIIYDNNFEGALNSVARHSVGLRGTTIMAYYTMLESFNLTLIPISEEAIIVLLCSSEHVLEIFQLIKQHNLISTHSIWMVLLRDSKEEIQLSDGLESLILEGTRIILLTKISQLDVKVSTSKTNLEGVSRFDNNIIINLSTKNQQPSNQQQIHPQQQQQQRPEPPPTPPSLPFTSNEMIYSNFKGRRLKVTSNGVLLFTELRSVTEDGLVVQYSGTEFSLLDNLAYKLNFTFSVVKSIDNAWGDLHPDGKATGMIGMVYRREVDLALAHISITRSRSKAVDYTVPFYLESLAILSRAPALRNPTFIVFSPFTMQVWLCIIIATLAVGPILKIFSVITEVLMGEDPIGSLQVISFTIFRIIMTQGNPMKTPSMSHRAILFAWYIVCLIVLAFYSGTLVAMLAIPSYEAPIDSLTDLPRAVREGFIIGTLRQTIMEYIFRDAKEGIYRDTWLLFHHKDLSKSLLRGSEGFDLVTQTKFAYIFSRSVLETQVIMRGKSRYHISRESIRNTWISVACKRGAPFRKNFDRLILWMTEGGLIDKWKNDEFRKLKKAKLNEEETTRAIQIKHLQAAFYVLLLGSLVAATVLGLEKTYSYL